MENYVEEFKQFASALIDDHVAQLKEKYRNEHIARSRLELFNQHLGIIKEEMITKINQMLVIDSSEEPAGFAADRSLLWESYYDFVNKFLRENFNSANKNQL